MRNWVRVRVGFVSAAIFRSLHDAFRIFPTGITAIGRGFMNRVGRRRISI